MISDVSCAQSELLERTTEWKNADERAKKATEDATRLAEELKAEQERSDQTERALRALEAHAKELVASSISKRRGVGYSGKSNCEPRNSWQVASANPIVDALTGFAPLFICLNLIVL